MDFSLLETLCQIPATSGDEHRLKQFLVDYVSQNSVSWKTAPVLFQGEGFQDNLILIFGKPTTAYYAHLDSVGFTTRYQNQMIPIGSPEPVDGDKLSGEDSLGPIECQIIIDENKNVFHDFARAIEPGTPLVYSTKFKTSGDTISSNYLDNRIGIFALLQLAKEIKNGALIFTTNEEHGGGSVGYLANFLFNKYAILKSLIVDVTWVTDGIYLGYGPVVSLRDSYIPRKKFVSQITSLLDKYSIVYQKEIEATGGSDGSELQRSPLPIDWCFIGVSIKNSHSSHEEANIFDITRLIALLEILSKKL